MATTKTKQPAKKTATKAEHSSYRGVNLDKLKGYTLKYPGGGGADWFKIDDKQVDQPQMVRLLPPIGDMDDTVPWTEHVLHYRAFGESWKMTDGSNRAITCLDVHGEGGCPVCELIAWLEDNDEADLALEIAPKKSFYANIVNRETGKLNLWNMPSGVLKPVLNFMRGKAGDITDPAKGRDLEVVKTRAGRSMRYSASLDLEASPIGVEGWQKNARDCTKLIKVFGREEIIDILQNNLGGMVPISEIFGRAKKNGKRGK